LAGGGVVRMEVSQTHLNQLMNGKRSLGILRAGIALRAATVQLQGRDSAECQKATFHSDIRPEAVLVPLCGFARPAQVLPRMVARVDVGGWMRVG
jgi:hypothetical protein